MGKIVTGLTVLTLALGAAAHAGTPAGVTPTSATSAKSSSPPATSLTYSSTSSLFDGGVENPTTPGATGRVIVPGSNSTIAGDSMATQMERTGALNSQ